MIYQLTCIILTNGLVILIAANIITSRELTLSTFHPHTPGIYGRRRLISFPFFSSSRRHQFPVIPAQNPGGGYSGWEIQPAADTLKGLKILFFFFLFFYFPRHLLSLAASLLQGQCIYVFLVDPSWPDNGQDR